MAQPDLERRSGDAVADGSAKAAARVVLGCSHGPSYLLVGNAGISGCSPVASMAPPRPLRSVGASSQRQHPLQHAVALDEIMIERAQDMQAHEAIDRVLPGLVQ